MYYLFVLGKALALACPRRFCYFIAKLLAVVHFYLSKKDREAVYYNFSAIVSDRQRLGKCASEVFVNFAYYLVDFFRYDKLNKNFIAKYVRISGLNYVDQALSSGKGAIVLSAHLGNYELGAAVLSLLGYPLYVVALPHRNKRLNNFFDAQRKLTKTNVIPTGPAVKRSLRVLNEGNLVAFLGDRDFTLGGSKTKMFSRYALLPRGAAFFALKAKVDVIPTFFIRERKFFYHFVFEKPISGTSCNNESEIVSLYASVLESYLRKYPEQWYLFEKYWL